jgi:malonyl-CoA O-methyltransferase
MSRLSKELIQQRFGRQLHDYRRHAVVQESMAERLAELTIKLAPSSEIERTLEIGAGSAGLTDALLSRVKVKQYFANDLVPESVDLVNAVTQQHKVKSLEFLTGDIEQLNLPQKLDLIISGATVQWLNDLHSFFRRMANALNDGGQLCFSSFGPENMCEIKELTQIGLNYHTLDELRALAEPWFDVEIMTEELHELEFSNPTTVLKHVSKTGVNGLNQTPWTRSQHRSFVERYQQNYSTDTGVQLTYHCLYCCLKKKVTAVQVEEALNPWDVSTKTEEMEMAYGW